MSKTPKKTSKHDGAQRSRSGQPPPTGFEEVLGLIDAAKRGPWQS